MVDAVTEKRKLLNRVDRLRGQIEAIERALGVDAGCILIMQLLTAARGAIAGLMAEVLKDHSRIHMIDAEHVPAASEARAANELVSVLRSYIR